MPIYEYECKKCGFRFEQFQKITDPILLTCPECEKDALVKLVSNTSFQLKGTGWYETDFKGNKAKAAPVAKDELPKGLADAEKTKSKTKTDSGSTNK